MATNDTRFCMCLAADSLSPAAQAALQGRKAALLTEYRWPAASIITAKFVGGNASLQGRVRDAARLWEEHANLRLNFVPSGDANLRIAFTPGAGSWSHLGTYCRSIPQSQPTMNYGWLTDLSTDEDVRSVVLHEFGHALGLIHEHQNPTERIRWNEPAVIRDLSGPPNNWDEAKIRRNVLDHYDPAKVITTEVDAQSIMMYPIPASWTEGGHFSAGLNTDLSARDRTFIRQCYP